MTQEQMTTAAEQADRLRIAPSTFWQHVRRFKIPFHKYGAATRFLTTEVDAAYVLSCPATAHGADGEPPVINPRYVERAKKGAAARWGKKNKAEVAA